jgi:hypothetical protein
MTVLSYLWLQDLEGSSGLRAQSSEQEISYLSAFLKLVSFLLKEISLG